MSRSTPLLDNQYSENQEKYLDIWAQIFVNTRWLEKQVSRGLVPALVGWDIQFIRSTTASSTKPLIALVLVEPELDDESLKGDESLEDFRNQLRSHDFNDYLGQIQFPNFDLDINHLFFGPGIYNMCEPTTLLEPGYFDRPNKVRTLVTYYGQPPHLVDGIFVDGWMLLITDDERKLNLLFVADSDEGFQF
ncbi:hypothetical protein FBEOM_14141 [Fusarium beomiforme]|uniref:Uncharacterized protein n=1 Tax=Fusarium beomiforme TaxID=44412 RepID=A0A9P5DRF6_9HYPO|nr:hypothetical protein FBEOM_14141 [Fusarium beomiforme]